MKSLYLYPIVIASAVLFLAFTTGVEEIKNKDVIKFSHKLHAEFASCAECHESVPNSTAMTDKLIPGKDMCATCHDVDDDDNCEMCHYEDVNEPLVQKSSHILFSHKAHITEDTQCETCHEGITEVNYASESAHFNPGMEDCASCHGINGPAPNSCESCHTSTVALVPDNHSNVDFMKNHKFMVKADEESCAMCHDHNFCESCHNATSGIGAFVDGADDPALNYDEYYFPYSPHNYVENNKTQQLSRVHDLNYRFSHGIDARGKVSDCASCHVTETFCANCHGSSGGGEALDGFMPASHRADDFMMVGVGSGGGKHAELAKRDIESCASCHDSYGGDPACLLCHMDPDGIEGTNPKTHERGFLSDEHGNWHDDNGAVCYNCHTDANAFPGGNKNLGFCGYCHAK